MTTELRAALLALATTLPPDTPVPVPASTLRELLDGTGTGNDPTTPAGQPATWRERLWTCPADTRLRVQDLAEALGRPKSWVYRAVAAMRGPHRLPASRLSGELVFVAGAVRAWLEREEQGA